MRDEKQTYSSIFKS